MPAAWITDFVVGEDAVQRTINRLVAKHDKDGVACFVAEYEDEIISFIWAEVNEKYQEIVDIYSLWTRPQYRGQGIATKLKRRLEQWVQEETSARQIQTTVNARNPGMVQLNQKLGYEVQSYKMVKKL